MVGLGLAVFCSTLGLIWATPCKYGVCTAETDFECCTPTGIRVTSEYLDNATAVLCRCQTHDSRHYERVSHSLVVVSIFALVGIVASIMVIFTQSMRQQPELLRATGRSSSFQQLVELVYKTKVAESKAVLIDAEPIHPDDRCPICLESLVGLRLARPPGCHHVFHRECIETWIDHVTPPDRDRGVSDEQLTHPEHTNRMLMCPVCARPFLETDGDKSRATVSQGEDVEAPGDSEASRTTSV